MTATFNENLFDKYFVRFLQNIAVDVDSFYHYTSPNAMIDIIKNHILWFSCVDFLNDESERKYIYLLVNSILDKYKSPDHHLLVEEIKLVCDGICSCQEDVYVYQAYDSFGVNNRFITSFSLEEDNLSLWRSYAKTLNSIGYNIEINAKLFVDYLEAQRNMQVYAGRVIYDNEIQNKIIIDLTDEYFTEYDRQIKELKVSCKDDNDLEFSIATVCQEATCEYIKLCNMFAPFFKHPAFSDEKEYRIVCEDNTDKCQINYREYHGFFIPYIKCEFPKTAINSITISPTQKQTIAEYSIRNMLENCGYGAIPIKNSKIPLRY